MIDLIVKESVGRGRGIFSARAFRVDEIIEVCPVIALSKDDTARLDATYLYNYYFGWGEHNKGAAIALGFGSLYNHSATPNARYQKNLADNTISITATRPIEAGEEILFTYDMGNAEPSGGLWFVAR